MPDISRASSPVLGATYRVRAWQLIVTVECLKCDTGSILTLINTIEATCPHCGAPFQCGGMKWDGTTPLPPPPQFAIAVGSAARGATEH
jgi:hypothetical protein